MRNLKLSSRRGFGRALFLPCFIVGALLTVAGADEITANANAAKVTANKNANAIAPTANANAAPEKSAATAAAPLRLRLHTGNHNNIIYNRLLNAALAKLNIHAKLTYDEMGGVLSAAQLELYDGIAYSAPHAPATYREEYLMVPEPVGEMIFCAFGQLKNRQLRTWADLAGLRVGMPKGSAGLPLLPPDCEAIIVNTYDDLVALMRSGNVDVCIFGVVNPLSTFNEFAGAPRLTSFKQKMPFNMWLHPRHQHLVEPLAEELRLTKESGVFHQIISHRAGGNKKPQILYLHSYHYGRDWEMDITTAVNHEMPETAYDLYHVFLDFNRFAPTPTLLEARFHQIHRDLINLEFDLILLSDDPALNFMLRYFMESFFRGLPVVFCGMNNFDPRKIINYPMFTGVSQVLSAYETVALMLRLHPQAQRLFIVNDHTLTSKNWRDDIEMQIAKLPAIAEKKVTVEFSANLPMAQLTKKVHELPADTLLLLSIFLTDADGNYFPPDKGAEMLAQISPVPVYNLFPLGETHHAIGGKIARGREQGQKMAAIAKDVLRGQLPRDIPIVDGSTTNVWEIDYPEMLKHGISEAQMRAAIMAIERAYAAENSRLFDAKNVLIEFHERVVPFNEQNPLAFWAVIIGGGLAIIMITFLLFSHRRQQRLNKLLKKQGHFLTKQAKTLQNQTQLLEEQAATQKEQLVGREAMLHIISERIGNVLEKSAISTNLTAEISATTDSVRFQQFSKNIYKMFDVLADNIWQLSTLFETMSLGFLLQEMIFDDDGNPVDQRFLLINPAGEKLLRLSRESIIGKRYSELAQTNEPPKIMPLFIEAMTKNRTAHFDAYIAPNSMNPIPLDPTNPQAFAEYGDGDFFEITFYSPRAGQFVGLFSDARERLRATHQLINAKVAADEANAAKSNFLARMSHEIRTPMNAIIGLSHLLVPTQLNAVQRDYIEHILSSAQNLLQLINSILDLSKVEAGKMTLNNNPFTLSAMLSGLINVVRPLADKKSLELVLNIATEIPENLYGDAAKIYQTLLNLCSNAIKFTERGEITIACNLVEKNVADQTLTLQFSVNDTGIGIPEKYHADLFAPFMQVDESNTRSQTGTGLGLPICKSFVELMGGKINVTSVAGKGTTFTFNVQLSIDENAVAKDVPDATNLKGLHVLVVDDNYAAREVLSKMLYSFDCRVDTAPDGKNALTNVQAANTEGDPYQLIMLDWKMPEWDGVETCRRIREVYYPDIRKMPRVIMVSAYLQPNVIEEATKLGVSNFLTKPCTPSMLCTAIVTTFAEKTRNGDVANGEGAVPSAPKTTTPSSSTSTATITTIAGVKTTETKTTETVGFSAPREGDALPSPPTTTTSSSKLSTDLSTWTVLLVEDNSLNRLVATEFLKQNGILCDIAENGAIAVEKVSAKKYDLIFMDVQMPVMDGYTATQNIRAAGNQMTIVAMTAHAMEGDREKSFQAGMNHHLNKPIDPPELRALLQKIVAENS